MPPGGTIVRYLLTSDNEEFVAIGRYLEQMNLGDYLKNHYNLPQLPYSFAERYENLPVESGMDSDGYAYVMHNGKRLYGPKEWSEAELIKYYRELVVEQDPKSPHRYLADDVVLTSDDVVADVGAAEGIFTLDVIDRVKKVYLFECDEKWMVPLEKTLAPWSDKYEIVRSYVGDKNEGIFVTLDEFFADKELTLVKADIEGAEPAMLRGGAKVLREKVDKLLVCLYHTATDEQTIKAILDEYRMSYRDNDGYMLVLINPKWGVEPYLRRGVTFAWR